MALLAYFYVQILFLRCPYPWLFNLLWDWCIFHLADILMRNDELMMFVGSPSVDMIGFGQGQDVAISTCDWTNFDLVLLKIVNFFKYLASFVLLLILMLLVSQNSVRVRTTCVNVSLVIEKAWMTFSCTACNEFNIWIQMFGWDLLWKAFSELIVP